MSEIKNIFTKVLSPYLTFILLFIGAGFISGGIVHLGEGLNTWDISLLVIGVILFVLGSYIQEVLYNKKNLRDEGVVLFLLYSLLLSIGIGMASGGTQHFVDTPEYSVYLIPFGLFLGLIAFILKQNIQLPKSSWVKMVFSAIVVSFLLWIILVSITKTYFKHPHRHINSHYGIESQSSSRNETLENKEIEPHGH